jgi:hypothetical protein
VELLLLLLAVLSDVEICIDVSATNVVVPGRGRNGAKKE